MSDFWRGRKVLVTGGSGFIGSHLVDRLVNSGAQVTAAVYGEHTATEASAAPVRVQEADLTRLDTCLEMCEGQSVVFNIAHVDGSVVFKRNRPAYILRQNMLITLNMLEAASQSQVERFLVVSSAEVYPHDAPNPTQESVGFGTMSDRLADGYTWSKRMSEVAARLYAKEHDIKIAIARPNNVYGPRDYFDEVKGRVIPMFIKRAIDRQEPIKIWGSGETIRTFLFVEDLTRGLVELVEKHCECDPVNFGGEEEISIRELAELVVRLAGSDVKIICDTDKPSGALKRMTDITKARELLGFRPAATLEAGLLKTIEAYRNRIEREAGSAVVGQ
jgi:nucleoside-diphosphate-sugar epimerase